MKHARVKALEAMARRDIAEWKEAKRKIELLNAEALASQKRAIEQLALGSSLRELLQHLCLAVESGSADICASVLILEAGRLRHAMAPSLPEDYCRAIDGVEIGPSVGSCGTAAFRRRQVVVPDIAVDPLWENYRPLARKHGLSACWSTPILSRSGEVLGTFAIYSRHPQTPTEEDLRQSEAFSQIAAVAIERERAKSALDESERRFRAVVNQTLGFLSIMTPEGKLLDVNDSFLQAIGCPRDQVLGRLYWETAWWDRSPEVQELLKADLLEAAGGSRVRRESPYFTASGEMRFLDRSMSPLRDREGHIDFVVAEGHDVTDRHRGEEKIRALNATLRQANESLENRARQLQASLREMEAFSYTLAHDLRAPLRSMAGYSQLLLQKIPDGVQDEDFRIYLDMISASASRMDRLILDLLEYNGLARSAASLRVVDADLVLSQVLGSMAEEIRECSAEIVREGPLPPVLGQPTLLASVLTNLLSNAIRFVARGRIPRVRLRAEKRDGKVRLWVEDNGIGIAPEYHARIFGVFERLHRMEDYPGTGMGLAIVARAVERMGGRVGVHSEQAQGSRFWIDLEDPQATPAA